MSRFITLIMGMVLVSVAFGDDRCVHEEQIYQADGRVFDPASGRETANFPPDMRVDYQHLKIELSMPKPEKRAFTARQTLSFRTLGLPVDEIVLDAVDLEIRSVKDGEGRKLEFAADDRRLAIRFDPPIAPNTAAGVTIEYACANPVTGMIFAIPDASYKDRPLHIHTQGQSEFNRHWFPSHDYPNDRMTSELIVSIPSKYKALGNGKLVERVELPGNMVRYHYALSKPHVSYLVSLVIGEFDVVQEKWRDIPVEYWVPPGQKDRVQRTFGKTVRMLDFFSDRLQFPYPYEKYAQSVVYHFSAGGMENTSTTTLTETACLDERAAIDQDLEGLIAHELAHQWFGDMITCRSWKHIWLNEGFATYFDQAWHEFEHGPDEYASRIFNMMRGVAEADDVTEQGGIVWPYYTHARETFGRRVSNPYRKGASVLHMLRRQVGDELFWKALAEYTKRFAWQQVETDDLRKVFDELSGRSFEQFFHQWVYRPGTPHLRADYSWNPGSREARISIEQLQKIAPESPAFVLDVPITLVCDNSVTIHRVLRMDSRSASIAIPCPAEPRLVLIDPELSVLARWDITLPVAVAANVARSAPTPGARLRAIHMLGSRDREVARQTLVQILDDKSVHYTQRVASADSLGRMQSPAARDALLAALKAGIADHKVRRAVVSALGQYRSDEVVAALIPLATSDPSYAVEAAASIALGQQRPTDDVIAVLLSNAKKESHRDQIRTAAVEALAALGDERGLDAAIELASYGQPFRSRPGGIDAIAKLARSTEAKDRALPLLIDMLQDPQDRSAAAATRALGEIGDARAIPALQRLVESATSEDVKTRCRTAIDAINRAAGESAVIRDLRRRVESLERARDRRENPQERQRD